MEVKPKPCPHCGKPPSIISTMFGAPYVVCLDCGIETRACEQVEQAVALWNTEQYERQGRNWQ